MKHISSYKLFEGQLGNLHGWKFKIETDDHVGTTVKIVSDEDHENGFDVSYIVASGNQNPIKDQECSSIINLMDELNCPELMEGVWEVSNEEEIRQSLINAGLEEIK